jgi:hypothetical protein
VIAGRETMVHPRGAHDIAPGVAELFDGIGADLKGRWRAAAFDEAAFTEFAAETLASHLRSIEVSLDDVLTWVQGAACLPTQVDHSFGDPITVFHDPRFYIDVLTWIDGTTSIHEHAFSGAFGVLQGASLHARYAFHPELRYSEQLALGRTERIAVELLRAGDVRPIWAGARSAHALFHLDRPSLSVVVRTPRTVIVPPVQRVYRRSGIAHNPHHGDIERARLVRSLDLMRELGHPDMLHRARRLIDARDPVTAFGIADYLAQKLSHGEYQAFLGEGGFRHRELFDALAADAADSRREHSLKQRRHAVHAGSHRFLLALLLNLDGLDEIKRMVEVYAPGRDPAAALMTWIAELVATPAIDPGEPNAIGLALDAVALRVVRCLLDGRTDREVLRDLAGEPGAVPDEAAVLARCAAVRSSIFAPLCRS